MIIIFFDAFQYVPKNGTNNYDLDKVIIVTSIFILK